MLWPLAQGLELIIVIEERRSLIEVQVREELYGSPNQPVCIGKRDEAGQGPAILKVRNFWVANQQKSDSGLGCSSCPPFLPA